ncbi:hypothetical protein [Agreia bicolorata]|uniref:hypothetical protein n=1 Tax=Agreia bicolorata TaxID=110935 RepID=UPI000AD1E465|nr:hypothetical protein [Agreia bicolorata]
MSVVSVEVGVSRRRIVPWVLVAAALVLGVAAVPSLVAEWSSGGQLAIVGLPGQVSAGFELWITSGAAGPGAALSDAVSFWFVFHVVKAVLALGLLAALIVAGCHIWSRAARASSSVGRSLWALAGVVGAWMPILALLVVIANIQGAIAPLTSVLTFLPGDATPAIEQVRAELASGTYSPATAALLEDFRVYHAALVVSLLVVVAGLVATTVMLWVQRARQPHENRRIRRILAAAGIVLPLLLPVFGLLLLANLDTVADTAPALAAFFDGSGT